MTPAQQQFGIAVQLPSNDPLSAPHLLGESWTGTRWYDSREQRDTAYEKMLEQPAYYRKGDVPSIVLAKIDP